MPEVVLVREGVQILKFDIPCELHQWLRVTAAKEGVSMRSIIIRLLQTEQEKDADIIRLLPTEREKDAKGR